VNIQYCTLNIHEQWIKFCRAFHQQLKCFKDDYQVPIAHSVFKQSVHNVTAYQLQQPTIEICWKKWYNSLINKLVKQIILYGRQNGHSAQYNVGQLWHVYSIVFQHNTPHMIIHWHISIWHTCYYFYTRITILLLVHLAKCTFKFK